MSTSRNNLSLPNKLVSEEHFSFVPVIKATVYFNLLYPLDKITCFKYVMRRWKRWISYSNCFSNCFLYSVGRQKRKESVNCGKISKKEMSMLNYVSWIFWGKTTYYQNISEYIIQ